MSADRRDVEHALLYALMALRVGVLDRPGLSRALRAWAEAPERPPGPILTDVGRIEPRDDALVRALVERHLAALDDDPTQSVPTLTDGAAERGNDLRQAEGCEGGRPGSPDSDGEHDQDPDRTRTFARSGPEPPGDRGDSATVADRATSTSGTGAHASMNATRSFTIPDPPEAGEPPRGGGDPPRAGRFAIVRPLARGNLGEVFVARDRELNREVALKEIRADRSASTDARARFVLEGEITGGLEHPGIVPVYSLGTHRHGRPFYAMRLIRGESLRAAIARFHDDHGGEGAPDFNCHNLALRRLLRRFVDVCDAVAYAHSRGVVHRDLKPANIMLGPFGETLVVDWGLAKPTGHAEGHDGPVSGEGPLEPSTADHSRDGSIRGTPAYMSPQQADGQPARPANDVYSLGSTLYTLVVGRNPFPEGTPASVLDQVRRGAFEPPCAANPRVPAALEAVCLKAMARDVADRYETAHALADDVERWLADEPVSVHRENWSERATRWERKHRALVRVAGAAAVLVATVSTVAAVLLVDAHREAREALIAAQQSYGVAESARSFAVAARNQAEQRAREVRLLIDDYLVPLVDRVHAAPDIEEFRRGLAETTAATYRLYLDDTPDEPGLPMKAARVFRVAAGVHRLLGEVDAAGPLYEDALRLLAAERDPRPDDPEGPAAMRVRLLMDRGTMHQLWGQLADAERDHEAALRELADLPANAATDRFRGLFEGALRLDRAGRLREQGRLAGALDEAEAARRLLGPLDDRPGTATTTSALRLMAEVAHAETLADLGRRDEAEALLVATRDRAWSQHRARGLDPNLAHVTAGAFTALARLLADDPARRAEALRACSYAYFIQASLFSDHQAMPVYRWALADFLTLRAGLRLAVGQRDGAASDLSTARDLLAGASDAVRDRPVFLESRAELAEAEARLARALGDHAGADAALGESLALRERIVALDPGRRRVRDDALRLRLQLNRVFVGSHAGIFIDSDGRERLGLLGR